MTFDDFCCRVSVCLCCSDVRGFATVISFSDAMDDTLSNKRWKDALQFVFFEFKPLSSLNMSFNQITSLGCNRQRSFISEYKLSNYSIFYIERISTFWMSTCFGLNFLQHVKNLFTALQKPCQSVYLILQSAVKQQFSWSKIQSSSSYNISNSNLNVLRLLLKVTCSSYLWMQCFT